MRLFVLLSWKIFLHDLDISPLIHVLQDFHTICALPFNFINGIFQIAVFYFNELQVIKFLFCL